MTDAYEDDTAIPDQFSGFDVMGPKGVALVKTWGDGRTQPGWGLNPPPGSDEGFMPRYLKGEFNARRALYGFDKGQWAFAFVMRSLRLVCIDIDGKNGGIEGAKKLGMLPPTLAETSKSGDGYHLFYLVDDEWDEDVGFGRLNDRIGIELGVDIRWTGCVYHYTQQRWNRRPLAALPEHLEELLIRREQKTAASTQRIAKILASDDDLEVLMLQDELVRELDKDIPAGKRNQTLFAIGSQLNQAAVPGWEEKISDRGGQIGLSDDEVDKIIDNIKKYS